MHRPIASKPIVLRLATATDREEIYRLRHAIYARELGQHAANADGRLSDALDEFNVYLVAACLYHNACQHLFAFVFQLIGFLVAQWLRASGWWVQ